MYLFQSNRRCWLCNRKKFISITPKKWTFVARNGAFQFFINSLTLVRCDATFVSMTPFSTFFGDGKEYSSEWKVDGSFRLMSALGPLYSLGTTTRSTKKLFLRNKSSLGVCSIIDSAERVNFSCITYPRRSERGENSVTNMWNVGDNAWSLNLIAQSRRRRRRTWHGAASGAIHLNSRPYLLSFRALRGRKINKQKWKMSFMWLIILNGSVFILIILSSFCLVFRNRRGEVEAESKKRA